jgi:PTS system mannose-specific IIC component
MMTLAALWVWGTAVGLDLISVGQFMLGRPLVAGVVAGAILGDPMAGGMVGTIFELFALDVLPVGAVRYPDYGIAAVAGTVVAADAPLLLGLGLAVAVGLVIAYLGEMGIARVRSLNSRDLRQVEERLDAGDWGVIAGVHRRGLSRDFVRAALVALSGLTIATLIASRSFLTVRGAVLVTVVMVGAAIGTAASGAMRLGGRGLGLKWFVLGLLAGLAVVLV